MSSLTLSFEATQGSAIDRQHDLEIFRPRVVPMERDDEAMFEFSIYRSGKRHGFACSGIDELTREADHTVRTTTLDLFAGSTVEYVKNLQQWLELPGDQQSFLLGLADGLAKSFQGETDNYNEELRYLIVVDDAALAQRDIPAPNGLPRLPDGRSVLASVDVPMHPLTEDVP